jgi:tRNA pseudouridine38-40 synthase
VRAFRIAYDGRPYHGYQRQPSVPTVEGELFSALAALGIADPGEPPDGYAAAGRTDAGVSALSQTVAFEAPEWCTPRALNAELPAEVRAWASAEVPSDFHATHDAESRAYRYHLHAPDLAREAVARPLSAIEGTHDFHNLTAVSDPDRDTVRTVRETSVERDGEFLLVELRAGGFLHEMVRRVVSFLEAAARGEAPAVDRVLSPETLSGPAGIGPAPAEPLVLADVEYPELAFEVDECAAESRRSVFEATRVEAASRARVAGELGRGPR